MTTARRKRSASPPSTAATAEPTPAPATSSAPLEVVPFNANHLEDARNRWALADWKSLRVLDHDALDAHPDRARLAVVRAAASIQCGDSQAAKDWSRRSLQWGCDRHFLIAVMLASARHALGRASAAARRDNQALQHFQQALFDRRLQSESRRSARARMDEVQADLAARRERATRERRASIKPGDSSVPGWIVDIAGRCISAPDVHEAVDAVLDEVLAAPDDRVRFLMSMADQFLARQDKMTALHFLGTAKEQAHEASGPLRTALAKRLVAEGQAGEAMDMVLTEAIEDVGADGREQSFAQAMVQAYKTAREAEQARREHGHELLLAYLKLHLSELARSGKALTMVEIGTTRENVPGQGSTRKLAEFCKQHKIDFLTVDMDPHNSDSAERMFEAMGLPFQAVTAKGEDYLRNREAPLDFIFLDAYDFDHGKHSELRQSRYLKYLGSRIDEQACHQMHLECAMSLQRLLTDEGIICIDDTWVEDGRWTAKGTLAVPFLLENGFELIDARNRAALLRRRRRA